MNDTDRDYPGKTKEEIREDGRYKLSKPTGPAVRNHCNNCSLTWYSAAFSDFILCIRCKSKSVANSKVLDT